MPEDALLVSSLTVRIGTSTILDHVELRVAAREALGVIGPTGSGKTTLARALLGLVPTMGGHIHLVNGQSLVAVESLPTWRRARLGITAVPESRHVFPDLTVRENLMAVLSWTRVPVGASRQLLADALTFCPPLRGHLSQLAGTLSGGEKRLLGIAMGLLGLRARQSKSGSGLNGYLIVDEPSHGLHPTMMNAVALLLENIPDATGIGVLLLEQFEGFARKICNRVLSIDRGRVV